VANSNVHFVVGAGVSAVVYLGFCRCTNRKATVWGVLGASLAGAVVASVPDLLEPAVHPNHRAFFHSLAALGLSAWAGLSTPGDPRFSQDDKLAVLLVSLAYVSHLILDGFTPRSLPLV